MFINKHVLWTRHCAKTTIARNTHVNKTILVSRLVFIFPTLLPFLCQNASNLGICQLVLKITHGHPKAFLNDDLMSPSFVFQRLLLQPSLLF